MATIELYKDKINSMSNYIEQAKSAVSDFCVDLSALKTKILGINSSVCDGIISKISTSSQTQEQQIAGLEATQREVNDFIDLTINRDNAAATAVSKAKKEFYKEYDYLKPDSEKSDWEKFCDDASEWCKENWKKIIIGLIFIVVGAILTALTGGTFLAALAAGFKAALIAGLFSGGFNVTFYISTALISNKKLSFSDALHSFGNGFASGFMLGGIFSGASMVLGSGMRLAIAKSPQLAQKMLSNGKISEFWLKRLVPTGAKNQFVPSTRIAEGYKYNIQVSKLFGNSTKFQIKWHSPDLLWAATQSNSGLVWTAQIKIGNKFMTTLGTMVRNNRQNIVHIPIIPWHWW